MRFEAELLDVKQLTLTVKHFTFSVPDGFSFIPGQYVSLLVPFLDGKLVKRPYSIASSPSQKGVINLTIKNVEGGHGTSFLFTMQKGDTLTFIGSLGAFTLRNKESNLVFISTGTGIGPFRSMIKDLLEHGAQQQVYLFTGYRYEEEILYDEEFTTLAKKYTNFHYYTIFSQPKNTTSEKGRVQDLLAKHLPQDFQGDFYLCGLHDMIDETKTFLEGKGFAKEHIYFERYD